MISGREGSGVIVGVAEAGGVAVRTKFVASVVGVICTATVCATAVAMAESPVFPEAGTVGVPNCANRLTMKTAIPAMVRIPVSAKERRARILFCWRVR
jgi:hypothetical protein